MTALSAEANLGRYTEDDLSSFPVAAAATIYRNGAVGINPAGHVKPFVQGDMFLGFAYETANNSAGAAAAINCKVWLGGDWLLPISSIALTDRLSPVFATDDATFALTGNADAFVGRVIRYDSSTHAVVRQKRPGEVAEYGCSLVDYDFTKTYLTNQVTSGGELFQLGLRTDAIGAGITAGAGVGASIQAGEAFLLLDNDNEAQNATIETMQSFNVARGIRFTLIGRLKTAGGAATDDLDFGLAALSTTGLTDTERANTDATTSGYKHAKFHLNTDANDVFFVSDDDATPVAVADTTFDNSTTVNAVHTIIVRATGAAEIWINGAQKLSTTAYNCGTTGMFAGFINLEKSTGTGVPEARVRRLRVSGGL